MAAVIINEHLSMPVKNKNLLHNGLVFDGCLKYLSAAGYHNSHYICYHEN